MAHIVVLGAGFGGLTAATELRRLLGPEHAVTVVDKNDSYLMGLRKLWILVGRSGPDEGRRRLAALADQGIRVVQAQVQAIDLAARRVQTTAGPLDYDYLVVALGAEGRPDLVPGMADHAHNLYDAGAVARLAQAVAAFPGGRVVLAIAGLPYKCPPAPYEAAMLLEAYFRQRGIRERVEIAVTSPQPMSLPIVGKAGCAAVETELFLRGIEFHPNRKVERIEASRVVYSDGELPADLIIAVPPHRCPAVVQAAGLTGPSGWVEVDPGTLSTGHPGVYAIGDVTEIRTATGMPLPKAGVFAEAQGRRVAAAIAAELTGAPAPPPFDGYGYCFVELGDGLARLVRGHFLAPGGPEVEIAGASPDHARAKEAFEAERLQRWFGG